ncbi:MAG: hypothetical protein ACRCXT_16580 [Paraclostridium sp.]
MELESRIIDVIFGWDMHNFVNDNGVDDKLEDILDAIENNSIKNLDLNKKLLDSYKNEEISDCDICLEVAEYLRENGKFLIVFETPIPKNIKKNGDEIISWRSNGFGFSRITVMLINSFDMMREKIKEFEEKMFEEEYIKRLEKV